MKRSNKRHYVIAHKAIKMANEGFHKDAAILCKVHGVSFETALRIITRPSKRRKFNPKDYSKE